MKISKISNGHSFFMPNLSNKRVNQAISLYSANLIGIPLGLATSIIITGFLGPSAFGDYKFLLSLFNLSIILLTFGFFQAGNRALVLNNDIQKAKEYYGAEFILMCLIFILMSGFLLVYAYFDKNIEAKNLSLTLFFLIPFSWVFLFIRYFEILFQADNKIHFLATLNLHPKLYFFFLALLLYLFLPEYRGDRLLVVWGIFFLSQSIVFLFILKRLKLSLKNLRHRLIEIWDYNKSYGFNVYLASIFAVGAAEFSSVLISYFGIDNTGVGYYSLAITIAVPLSLIPNVIATTYYKDFSTMTRLPLRPTLITFTLSITAFLMLWILVDPFIRVFYGEEFLPVILLSIIVGVGLVIHGMADYFNRFLGSHGEGKALRNSAFVVGLSLMLANIILIPLLGATGAAFTKVIGGCVYLFCMVWSYKRLVSKLEHQPDSCKLKNK